jgi:hypothetical protein
MTGLIIDTFCVCDLGELGGSEIEGLERRCVVPLRVRQFFDRAAHAKVEQASCLWSQPKRLRCRVSPPEAPPTFKPEKIPIAGGAFGCEQGVEDTVSRGLSREGPDNSPRNLARDFVPGF